MLNNADITTGAGNISLFGKGWNDAATSNLYGMYLLGSSSLSTSTGNITLNGTGGNGATTNYGVYI